MTQKLWLRSETKLNEQRCALTPTNAKRLIDQGVEVIVEKSPMRIFDDIEYEKVGAKLVEEHSWITDAPVENTFILGLKELEENSFPLKHNHIYFAHIYKGQHGAKEVFKRYQSGGGHLYDLEFLENDKGRRVAAFGYWAGYAGAALSVENYAHLMTNKSFATLKAYKSTSEWLEILKSKLNSLTLPKVIIIGALGRCGSGARDLCQSLGITTTDWDYEDTKDGGPFKEILDHDIFINTVLMNKEIPPFLNKETLSENKDLKLIADVSCDPNSSLNPIPIYNTHTTWESPTVDSNGVKVIAIDNLPSSLPKESSIDFSDQLIDHLEELLLNKELTYTWLNAKEIFLNKMKEVL